MTKRIFNAEGLVLRTRPLGEADRLVTLLTFQEGKFVAVARGARKLKSKLAAGIDLFTLGCYTFYRGRSWPIITGQESVEHFLGLREDPDLYYYGLYLAELADHLVSGEEPCPDICRLLLEGWRMLDQGVDRFLLCRAFELKLAAYSGYSPGLHSCINCGSDNTAIFSPRQGGLLCSGCRSADVIELGSGTIALARRLIKAPLAQVGLVRTSAGQRQELNQIIAAFLAYHLDLDEIKSRRLLKE